MSSLSEDELKARAALLGMRYHPGNYLVPPFFYRMGRDGIPDAHSMINAVTLEVMTKRHPHLRYSPSYLTGYSRAASRLLFTDFGANKL